MQDVQLFREVPEQVDVPAPRSTDTVLCGDLERGLDIVEEEATKDGVEEHEDRQANCRQAERQKALPEPETGRCESSG